MQRRDNHDFEGLWLRDSLNYTFLRVQTDAGISGVGEATLEHRELALEGAVRDIRNWLIGKDPFAIERIWYECYRDAYWLGGPAIMSALSGLDQALWDIKGKALGVPVYELLGGKFRDSIPAYATAWHGGAKTPSDLAARAHAAVKTGFKALKLDPFGAAYMQLGHNELTRSLEILQAIRDSVGPDIEILIEGHGRFDVPTAVTVGGELEKMQNIGWFEEPVPPDSIESLAQVRRKLRIPIACGERHFERKIFFQLLQSGAADVLQPDVTHAGGISEVRKIADMAHSLYVRMSPHNSCGPVACAATLQLAASLPNFSIMAFAAVDVPYRGDLSDESLVLSDGSVLISDKPGLGIELNDQCLNDHPYQRTELYYYRDDDPADSDVPKLTPYYEVRPAG